MIFAERLRVKVEHQLKEAKIKALARLVTEDPIKIFPSEVLKKVGNFAYQHQTDYIDLDGVSYLVRGLGNGVVYLHTHIKNDVACAYYIDTISGKAINILALTPKADICVGDGWAKDRENGVVYFQKQIENIPSKKPKIQSLNIPDDLRHTYNTIIAPTHELMHELHANMLLPAFGSTIHDLFLKNKGRGLSLERTACDMTLAFIRLAKEMGVDILRGINKHQFIKFVNTVLTLY